MSDVPESSYDGTLERIADGGVIRFERHLPYPIREVWGRDHKSSAVGVAPPVHAP